MLAILKDILIRKNGWLSLFGRDDRCDPMVLGFLLKFWLVYCVLHQVLFNDLGGCEGLRVVNSLSDRLHASGHQLLVLQSGDSLFELPHQRFF